MARISDSLRLLDKRPDTPAPEMQILLAVASPRSRAHGYEPLRQLLESDLNWAFLLLAAFRHGLLPLLHARLLQCETVNVPEHVQRQLSQLSETNRRRLDALRTEHERLRVLLDAAGIPSVSLSMPALASYYNEPGERQAEPLELRIQANDAAHALRALRANGFRGVHPLSEPRELVLLRARHLPLHDDAADVRVHLQARSLPRFLDSAKLDASSRRTGFHEHAGALSPELLLLRTCLCGSLNGWTRIVWLADVARIIDRSTLDWLSLLDAVRDETTRRMFLVGLQMSHDLLDTDLPGEIHALIAADPTVVKLAHQLASSLRQDRRGYTLESERLRYRLQLMTGVVRKARFALTFTTTPDVDDVKAIPVPGLFTPVYTLVRPTRILGSVAARLAKRVKKAPYYGTPPRLVEKMLDMAQVGPQDVVFDLGCGDGRVVIAAAARGAKAVGIDIDPELISRAQLRAIAEGVQDHVRFHQSDLTASDLTEATVVFLWLSPRLNLALRPRLRATLQPGARVISHAFDMGDWLPDRTELFVGDNNDVALAYLWTISPMRDSDSPPAFLLKP